MLKSESGYQFVTVLVNDVKPVDRVEAVRDEKRRDPFVSVGSTLCH